MPPGPYDHYERLSDEKLMQRAQHVASSGQRFLEEAEVIFRLLAGRSTDPFIRGRMFQRLWTIEQKLGRHPWYFSQAGQDRYLDQVLFQEKRDGVFVEIGAFDGLRGSNCLFFEKFRNWRGVVVEAIPDLAARIPETRDAPVVQAAICGNDGTAELVHVTDGLLQMSGLVDSYSREILKRVRSDPRHQERRVTVPAMRLDTLLRSQGFERVDYCSIDVEGAERSVLSGFDFAAAQISVFSVENATNTEADSMRDLLEPAGYKLVAILGADEIWSRL